MPTNMLNYTMIYPPIYPVGKLAEMLNMSPDTIKGWIKSGEMRASKMGGSKNLCVSAEDLMEYYDAHETRPKKGAPKNEEGTDC